MSDQYKPKVLGPSDGDVGFLTAMGVRFMVSGKESGGGFALVEHPMPPHTLGDPLHRHNHEDEYSFVLQGRIAALLGNEVIYGNVGDLIFKPRGQWHIFWNAGEQPVSLQSFRQQGLNSISERWWHCRRMQHLLIARQ